MKGCSPIRADNEETNAFNLDQFAAPEDEVHRLVSTDWLTQESLVLHPTRTTFLISSHGCINEFLSVVWQGQNGVQDPSVSENCEMPSLILISLQDKGVLSIESSKSLRRYFSTCRNTPQE
jgi:hypothetical protein